MYGLDLTGTRAMMIRFRYACIVLLLFARILLCDAAEQTTMHFGRDQSPSVETDIAIAVLKKAYAKIGIVAVFDPYPLRRSLKMADLGLLDGDTMRFEQAFSESKNLIRVPVAIVQIRSVAYMRADCPAELSWSELRGRRVAYQRGIKLLEARLENTNSAQAASAEDTLRMLQKGIADVAVTLEQEARIALRSGTFAGICKVEQPLEITPLFHALNRRHGELAQRLEKVLREMARNGEIRMIWDEEQARIFNSNN